MSHPLLTLDAMQTGVERAVAALATSQHGAFGTRQAAQKGMTKKLVVAADAARQDRAFALALDDGSLVPVTGDLDERWANARVSARVREIRTC